MKCFLSSGAGGELFCAAAAFYFPSSSICDGFNDCIVDGTAVDEDAAHCAGMSEA